MREGVHLSSLRTDTPRNRKIQQSETNREKRETKRVHCEPKLKGGGKLSHAFFLAGARCLSAGHHLRLTRGPAGNRTTTGSLSASPRTTPYQLSRGDTWGKTKSCGE